MTLQIGNAGECAAVSCRALRLRPWRRRRRRGEVLAATRQPQQQKLLLALRHDAATCVPRRLASHPHANVHS